MGLSIAVIAILVVAVGSSNSQDWQTLLGLAMIAQIIFAIIGANRLMKEKAN